MYERCTPEEKRRPIEEAIDELLFFQPPRLSYCGSEARVGNFAATVAAVKP
jgi:hypothetical protein